MGRSGQRTTVLPISKMRVWKLRPYLGYPEALGSRQISTRHVSRGIPGPPVAVLRNRENAGFKCRTQVYLPGSAGIAS